MSLRSTPRFAPAVAAALLLAACNGGGSDAPPLTPTQVQGVYNVCRLSFAPSQTALPVANLLQTVVNPAPPPPRQAPSLALSGQDNEYQLLYTRRSDNFLQQLSGSVELRPEQLLVRFPSSDDSEPVREALLPGQLLLQFLESPRRLEAVPYVYTVRRADYARAAGITEEGLQDRISGQLTASFSTAACP